MNLLDLRKEVRALSGRHDLVDSNGADIGDGATRFINAGMQMVESRLDSPIAQRVFQRTGLAGESHFWIPKLRTLLAVYARKATEDRIELDRLDYKTIRDDYVDGMPDVDRVINGDLSLASGTPSIPTSWTLGSGWSYNADSDAIVHTKTLEGAALLDETFTEDPFASAWTRSSEAVAFDVGTGAISIQNFSATNLLTNPDFSVDPFQEGGWVNDNSWFWTVESGTVRVLASPGTALLKTVAIDITTPGLYTFSAKLSVSGETGKSTRFALYPTNGDPVSWTSPVLSEGVLAGSWDITETGTYQFGVEVTTTGMSPTTTIDDAFLGLNDDAEVHSLSHTITIPNDAYQIVLSGVVASNVHYRVKFLAQGMIGSFTSSWYTASGTTSIEAPTLGGAATSVSVEVQLLDADVEASFLLSGISITPYEQSPAYQAASVIKLNSTKTYIVSFVVTGLVNGSVTPYIGLTAAGTAVTTNGRQTQTIAGGSTVVPANVGLYFLPNYSFDGGIQDIRCRENLTDVTTSSAPVDYSIDTVRTTDGFRTDARLVTIMPPLDDTYEIEAVGVFAESEMVNDTDENYWSLRVPRAIVFAACQRLSASIGDSKMAQIWDNDLNGILFGSARDQAREASENID